MSVEVGWAYAVKSGQHPVNGGAQQRVEQVLGAYHPSTLICRNNLGLAYQAAVRTAEAIPLYERTLADCERLVGTEHPITDAVRRNLGAVPRKGRGRRRWYRRK